jgi:DNA-binding GntR family transcriptional regulator
VQILPRRGVIVTHIDVRFQIQVLETRRELDRLIARLAARRATAAERERMAAIAKRMAKAVAAGEMKWAGADATMRLHVDLAKALASDSEDEAATASDRLIDDLADFARSTVAS